ncbi:MAG: hypothetical protein U0610_18625 [bacterium]
MSTIGVCLTRRWIPAVAALGLSVACTPQTFQKALGGTREDKGYSLEETQDHGYVVAGQSNSFSQAQRSIDYLVKTNASGELEWQNNAYGGDFAVAFAVAQLSDGGYLLAGNSLLNTTVGRAYLVRVDSIGELVWAHDYPQALEFDSVRETADGNIVVAGVAGISGSTEYDAYLAKLDSNGAVVWERQFGAAGRDWARSIRQTSDGGFVLAGIGLTVNAALLKVDADGNLTWRKTYIYSNPLVVFYKHTLYDVRETPDGGFAAAGWVENFASERQGWVLRTDAQGTRLWDALLTPAGSAELYSIAPAWNGGYVVAGNADAADDGNLDAYLANIDDDGTIQWQKTYGGTGEDAVRAVQKASDGGYALAGWTKSFGAGGRDVYLIKTDGDGNSPATP